MNQDRTNRQLNIATAIVHDIAEGVTRGIPADAALKDLFRQKKEFGARDRRTYAHIVFSWFRWRGWVEKLAPGDLQRQCELAIDIDAGTTKSELPIDDLMPPWLTSAIPEDKLRYQFIQSCNLRPPTWLAVAPEDVESFSALLTNQQIEHICDSRITGSIAITSRFHLATLEDAWGKPIQVQDIASRAVSIICNAKPDEHWWDACAGAGGKTLALARAVGTQGRVLATDIRSSILSNLRIRAGKETLVNIDTAELDASTNTPGAMVDGILIDAPCSGLGTWPRNPDARWRMQADDITRQAERQRQIISNASSCVKPGGTLVYSVCSIIDAEGPAIIKDFIAHHPEFALEDFVHPLAGRTAAGLVTIYPWEGPGDGMFIARLRRTSGNRS